MDGAFSARHALLERLEQSRSCRWARWVSVFVVDLRNIDLRSVPEALTVVGKRMILELRGISCLGLDLVLARRKGCAVTRSFSGLGDGAGRTGAGGCRPRDVARREAAARGAGEFPGDGLLLRKRPQPRRAGAGCLDGSNVERYAQHPTALGHSSQWLQKRAPADDERHYVGFWQEVAE